MESKKPQIYFAAALFSFAEQKFNKELASALTNCGYTVFLPQESCSHTEDPEEIFNICTKGIDNSDIIVAILENTDVDSGTAWECGYAYGTGKPVIGVRTNFRRRGDDGGLNCMLSRSSDTVITDTNLSRLIGAIDLSCRSILG